MKTAPVCIDRCAEMFLDLKSNSEYLIYFLSPFIAKHNLELDALAAKFQIELSPIFLVTY